MKDYLANFEQQGMQEAKTFEKVLPVQPTKPTKPSFVGFVGIPPSAFSKVEGSYVGFVGSSPSAFSKVSVSEEQKSSGNEEAETFEKALPALPTKPTKPNISLEVKAEADREVLRNHKAAFLRLLADTPCPRCNQPLATSGPYHSWCDAGHYDSQSPIPAAEAANHCGLHHDPLTDGQCARCEPTTETLFIESTSVASHDHIDLWVGHCKRCGDYLQPDGSCQLCKRPLPF